VSGLVPACKGPDPVRRPRGRRRGAAVPVSVNGRGRGREPADLSQRARQPCRLCTRSAFIRRSTGKLIEVAFHRRPAREDGPTCLAKIDPRALPGPRSTRRRPRRPRTSPSSARGREGISTRFKRPWRSRGFRDPAECRPAAGQGRSVHGLDRGRRRRDRKTARRPSSITPSSWAPSDGAGSAFARSIRAIWCAPSDGGLLDRHADAHASRSP